MDCRPAACGVDLCGSVPIHCTCGRTRCVSCPPSSCTLRESRQRPSRRSTRPPAPGQSDHGGLGHVRLRPRDGRPGRPVAAGRHPAQDDHPAAAGRQSAAADRRNHRRHAQLDRAGQRRHRGLHRAAVALPGRRWAPPIIVSIAGQDRGRVRRDGRPARRRARRRRPGAEHLLPERQRRRRFRHRSGAVREGRRRRAQGVLAARSWPS